MGVIDNIIEMARRTKASDIHLTEGTSPVFRHNGQLITDGRVISREEILELLDEDSRRIFDSGKDVDFAVDMAGGRQRVNVYRESGNVACAIRLLNDTIPTLEMLRLPPVLRKIADEPRGLVLVTGPTGSGKSTTLASMIDYIAKTKSKHIITVEDPIEYIYDTSKSLIHQREVGKDVASFSEALRSAMREDPDVMLVGEMRDYETISAAVTAAETGHLVFSTLHTTGAAKTVDRIIDVFPPHAQGQIRSQLAGVLKAVVTQQLVPLAPDASGAVTGRIAATEIMLGIDAIASLIREGKGHQINNIIQSKASMGMMTMDSCLAGYVRNGLITRETAEEYSSAPDELRALMR